VVVKVRRVKPVNTVAVTVMGASWIFILLLLISLLDNIILSVYNNIR
jgi:hypothetical protein